MTPVTTYVDTGAMQIMSTQPSPVPPVATVWAESADGPWVAVFADVTWDPATGLVRAGFAEPTRSKACLVVIGAS